MHLLVLRDHRRTELVLLCGLVPASITQVFVLGWEDKPPLRSGSHHAIVVCAVISLVLDVRIQGPSL